jgi:putative polyketide hydroxylase
VWIEKDGQRVSTLDLFGHELVLLTRDTRWIAAARAAGARLPLPFKPILVGVDIAFPADVQFDRCFGVSPSGTVLIRPDGIIAWRCRDVPVDATAVLEASIRAVSACLA